MTHPDDAELDYYATLPERMAGKPMPPCPVCGGSEHERGCPEAEEEMADAMLAERGRGK